MTEIEQLRVALQTMAQQRNQALDQIVNLTVELAISREKPEPVETKVKEKK